MPTFNFGQGISQAVGSALDRIQRAAFRATQLQQAMEEREIQQGVEAARQRFRSTQLALEQDRFRTEQAFQERQFQQEQAQTEALVGLRGAQQRLTEQRITDLQADEDEEIDRSALRIELQAASNRLNDIDQQLDVLETARDQVFDTGQIPESIAGRYSGVNPFNVLKSLTRSIVRLRESRENVESRRTHLQELAGTLNQRIEAQNQQNQQATPIRTTAFD